jgi:predicted transcriptional regulator of viral defense system
MRYVEFREVLKDFTIFSLSDIRKIDENFHRRRLNEWQDKGYIKKLIDKYYIFSDSKLNENILFEIANRIYSPSYISLEMALSYYNLIPDTVYTITSISTRRTYTFNTSLGDFAYRTMKSNLFFGYQLINYNDRRFKIGSVEKVILDYLYLNPNIKREVDFKTLRINRDVFIESVNKESLFKYLEGFNQKALKIRIKSFLEFIKNA